MTSSLTYYFFCFEEKKLFFLSCTFGWFVKCKEVLVRWIALFARARQTVEIKSKLEPKVDKIHRDLHKCLEGRGRPRFWLFGRVRWTQNIGGYRLLVGWMGAWLAGWDVGGGQESASTCADFVLWGRSANEIEERAGVPGGNPRGLAAVKSYDNEKRWLERRFEPSTWRLYQRWFIVVSPKSLSLTFSWFYNVVCNSVQSKSKCAIFYFTVSFMKSIKIWVQTICLTCVPRISRNITRNDVCLSDKMDHENIYFSFSIIKMPI